jgi:uncharacterized protein YprB with RNaseH-like and TPR domain
MSVRSAPPLVASETAIVAGEETTPHGAVWYARAAYEAEFRHGHARIDAARQVTASGLALVARDEAARQVAPDAWVVLDVESTGLGARAGTFAFLVGIGAWHGGSFAIEQFLLRDPSEEPALLHAVALRLQRAAGLLTFNGKAFDVPLLQARCTLARQSPPPVPRAHCDLLHAARRIWSSTAGTCRLAALERRHLGVRRGRDVAGRDVPERYLDYLRGAPAAILDDVLRHNRADLLSLALLATQAARFPERAQASGDAGGDAARDRVRAARLYAAAGDTLTAAALYAACLGDDVPQPERQAARAWLARTAVRAGDLVRACVLWQAMLAEEPDRMEPYADLAKTFEHRLRDPARALDWVEAGLRVGRVAAAAADALAHRRGRLVRKLGGPAQPGLAQAPGDGAMSGVRPLASLDGPTRTLLP